MHSLYPSRAVVFWLFSAVYLFFTLAVPRVVSADPIPVAVIYPDLPPPYNRVLSQIISGIKQQKGINVIEYPLGDEYESAALRKKLEQQNTQAVIALGRRGTEAIQALKWDKPVIVGAASLTSTLTNMYGKSLSAIRLSPAPDLLFARLREFSPQSKRIIVVTRAPVSIVEGRMSLATATEEAWLLSAAREAAKKYDFELVVYTAVDVYGAANLYRRIMESIQPETDALWLPPDDESIDIRSILPPILQSAWDRNVIIFCSTPAYVKRGALFALYPDNLSTGRHLAVLAMDAVKNGRGRILSIPEALIAVNIRTAEHLRLRKIDQKDQNFDAVYPAP